ncbi:NAD(P)-dependent dehydrogenase (short-subunit alcohol dehydrogenase family) [Micromonospora profundi]|uniref:SDR family NAD(P)-dependent oxidoreductase n=1 Tax=Micromonospora profundi TaxID=1420889 RepID=UPI001438F6CF|nr:SDR family oxidoreductase [Micromonospora profundi]NJC14871.1 NAD(P)-dependent dehydrogenase (short-subunit alcohol dehydrogenase family) [Micromonospora profundi]
MLIVTGAGRGIGAAVARRAASAGMPVCINYLRSSGAAEALAAEIRDKGGDAVAVRGDVSVEEDVRRLFDTAVDRLGPLTALVNNASSTGGLATVMDLTMDQADLAYRTVLRSVLLCTREAARRMAVSRGGVGGRIVNVSSTGARTGGTGEWVHYAALKAAVNAHTWGAARELAEERIRINAVAPGLIDTDLHRDNGVPQRPELLRPTVPLGRIGTPDEVAEAVWFLLSDASSYITGSVLEVGGGR